MANERLKIPSQETICAIGNNIRVYDDRQERSKWWQFKEEIAPSLPYPQNLLLVRLFPADFFYREADNFLNVMSDEERADVIAGIEWALQTLPTKMRLAIEYYYRDHLRPKDGGKLLNCTGREFTSFRKRGEQRIQYIAHPVFRTIYESGLTKAREEWGRKMKLIMPSPIDEIGLPDYIVKMLQKKMFLVTSDITTSEWRYDITNLAICYDLPLTEKELQMIYFALIKADHVKRKSIKNA